MSFDEQKSTSQPKLRDRFRGQRFQAQWVWPFFFGLIVATATVLAGQSVFADSGPSRDLTDNVSEGPRNGIVNIIDGRFCVSLKSYVEGGPTDDYSSCAPKAEVKNFGLDYSEGAVNAPKVDPIEGQVLSITAFEIKGGASGLLLGPPVPQKKPGVAITPKSSPTVPAPVVVPTQPEQPTDLPGAGGS